MAIHTIEKSDTTKYYAAHGGETEWIPAIPAIEHVPAVEATYDENNNELTPFIPEVEAQDAIPAKAPRVHIGVLDTGLTLTTGQPNLQIATDIVELLEKTEDIDLTGHNELPKQGETVEAGIYTFGDSMVVCRQEHIRTEHNPHDIPALFSFYRDSAEGLPWIEMEKVELGETRIYGVEEIDEGDVPIIYEVIQAHTTQKGWEPDKTPALWQVVVIGGEIADWVQPEGGHDAYNTGDEVMFETVHYRSLIDANVWSPAVHAAGWEIV